MRVPIAVCIGSILMLGSVAVAASTPVGLDGELRDLLQRSEFTGRIEMTLEARLGRPVNRGLATKEVKEMRDIYQPFLFAALMLLVIEAAIGTRRRQKYPEAP